MSINWNWTDKMGTVTDQYGTKLNLYKGNCFMIAIYEYKENGKDYYTLRWFFADENHLKNCLGLNKEYKENSPDDYQWQHFHLNTRYKQIGKFLKALADAKAKVSISLYYEEEKERENEKN